MYNLTNVTQANTLHEVIIATNSLSGSTMMTAWLLILFLLFLVIHMKRDFKTAMLVTSFFTTIVAVYSFVLEYIGVKLLIIPIIIFVGSFIAYTLDNT